MPPKKFKTKVKRDRKAEAMARLRAYWEESHEGEEWCPEKEPIITPLLKAVEGGIPRVLEALRMHDDDDAQAFIECYDALPATDRGLVSAEFVAHASGIGSLRLAELCQTALFLYASAQTKLLISGAMPKVTNSIIKAATDSVPILDSQGIQVGRTNGDVKAMELFGKMSGIVPIPKGAQIAIQNNYRQPEDDGPPPPAWRDSGERLREFHDMTEPKRLPSPESKPFVVGGHIDKIQSETVEILRGE